MKNVKYIIPTTVLVSMLIISSCKKSFYTDANINHNAPPSVTPASLLSSAEGELAYTQGGTFDLFITLFDQQTQGIGRQSQAYYQYIITNQDVDDPWSTWYTNVMSSCKDLMTQADAKGYNAYSGVGRILMAYSLQVLVDVWGDIPYSQALQGTSNLYPAYDKAATLYTTIGGLIDAGIADLNNANAGALVPGNEDIIYGGVAANWIKFGHAIKARLAIHQSKGNAAMATAALSEIALSFTSNVDNAQYIFGTTEASGAPWYQFNEERGGDVSFTGSTLATIMAAQSDPRYTVYFDSTFHDVNGVGLGAYYGNINSPIELICYDELQFMAAEANLRNGNAAAAQTAFTAAITANMQKLGVPAALITAYLNVHDTLPANVNNAIDSVSTQEYLALYLNPEAFTLWRRTNSPSLTPVTGSNGVPRRLLYAQTEYERNGANVSAEGNVTLWAPKLFWDN